MNETQYLLIKLMEECAEVQMACSKALLFGLDDKYPNDNSVGTVDYLKDLNYWWNKRKIEMELNDLLGVVDILIENNTLGKNIVYNEIQRLVKKNKVIKWMKYSRTNNILTEEY